MKKILISIIACLTLTTIYSQQEKKEKELSNAELFSNRSGTLIQKTFTDVGDVNKCKVQTAVFTDLIDGKTTKAVRFEYESNETYSSSKIALLDTDEIEALLKSIKIIQDKILATNPPESYTEVNFRSRSGFQAGCFNSRNKWTTFMQLERYDNKSILFMNQEGLAKLQTILEEIKSKM